MQSFHGRVIFHFIYVPHFFIYPSLYRHLGYFHVLAIVNSAAVNTEVPVSFSIMVFSEYMTSSGIAGSYGSFIPSSSSNLHSASHRGCTSPHSYQVQEGSLFSIPSPAFIVSKFFDDDHPDRIFKNIINIAG